MKKIFFITILAIAMLVSTPVASAQKRKAPAKRTTTTAVAKSPLFDILFAKGATVMLRDANDICSKLIAGGFEQVRTNNTTMYTSDDSEVAGVEKIFVKSGITVNISQAIEEGYEMTELTVAFENAADKKSFLSTCKANGASNLYGMLTFRNTILSIIPLEDNTLSIAYVS